MHRLCERVYAGKMSIIRSLGASLYGLCTVNASTVYMSVSEENQVITTSFLMSISIYLSLSTQGFTVQKSEAGYACH